MFYNGDELIERGRVAGETVGKKKQNVVIVPGSKMELNWMPSS